MKVRVAQTEIGDCWLTDEHPCSSYGQPVLVDDEGNVYGPGDLRGYIHMAGKPRKVLYYDNTVPVYDREWEPIEYSPEEREWVEDLFISQIKHGPRPTNWKFGASWQTERVKQAMQAMRGYYASIR
jgi:hypothetical protein